MEGVKQRREQDFEPVVYESVIDVVAGGGTIDVAGYVNADGLILAGLPVSPKNGSGLHTIVSAADIAADVNGDVKILGYVHKTVAIDANPLVGIVIEGVVRKAMLGLGYDADTLSVRTPKVTFI
jgi:hypothetical protein